jgi:hypothetical protein
MPSRKLRSPGSPHTAPGTPRLPCCWGRCAPENSSGAFGAQLDSDDAGSLLARLDEHATGRCRTARSVDWQGGAAKSRPSRQLSEKPHGFTPLLRNSCGYASSARPCAALVAASPQRQNRRDRGSVCLDVQPHSLDRAPRWAGLGATGAAISRPCGQFATWNWFHKSWTGHCVTVPTGPDGEGRSRTQREGATAGSFPHRPSSSPKLVASQELVVRCATDHPSASHRGGRGHPDDGTDIWAIHRESGIDYVGGKNTAHAEALGVTVE